ncbi:hypothetical protein F0562_010888 [Nyssa sinensis]|uniref:Inositol polyphosphate multikinase n=1 Tax=Nyssa sinensis TaxID=561372 RepID=A0A5J5A058_9ASTE|nr:hypothetical protein F0562_010888 [Nyssa sinensis]
MLKKPLHQVAGHQASEGQLGPLIDDSGHFYKPLQSDERGSNELAFYTSLSSNTRIPDHICRFFPVFYGTQLLEASDGSGLHPHLVLQDLVSGHLNPDSGSPEKKLIQKFSAKDVRLALRKFVSSNAAIDSASDLDCSFASVVYGGSNGILAQLLELKAWFEDQTIFHFYSCSVLLLYEKELALKGRSSGAEVKLIDFAHVVEGRGIIDHNFLGGLCSLIKFISEIHTTPGEYTNKACLQEAEKNQFCSENGINE